MKTSENIKTISKALNEAQKNIGSAKKGSDNPFFKSKYADYNEVLKTIKEPLNNQGITVLQSHGTRVETNPSSNNSPFVLHYVETILLHETGEFISSETPIFVPEKKKDDPQALGSAISYARRYGLSSLISLPTEDDDGEKAMNRPKPPKKKEPTNDLKKSGLRRI